MTFLANYPHPDIENPEHRQLCDPHDFSDPTAYGACVIDGILIPDAHNFSDPIAYSLAYHRAIQAYYERETVSRDGHLPYHYGHGMLDSEGNLK